MEGIDRRNSDNERKTILLVDFNALQISNESAILSFANSRFSKKKKASYHKFYYWNLSNLMLSNLLIVTNGTKGLTINS